MAHPCVGGDRTRLEGRVLGVEDMYALRRKVLVEGKSERQVAREMGLARNTVRRYLATPVPGARRGRCWSGCDRGLSS